MEIIKDLYPVLPESEADWLPLKPGTTVKPNILRQTIVHLSELTAEHWTIEDGIHTIVYQKAQKISVFPYYNEPIYPTYIAPEYEYTEDDEIIGIKTAAYYTGLEKYIPISHFTPNKEYIVSKRIQKESQNNITILLLLRNDFNQETWYNSYYFTGNAAKDDPYSALIAEDNIDLSGGW